VESDVLTGIPGDPSDDSGDGASAGGAMAALSVRPSVIGASGATVSLRVPQAGASAGADLAVFDVAGRRVATLASGARLAGTTSLAWDGRGADGRSLASGPYFLRLSAGGTAATERVLIVR
jgi:flagellar hook assembly protein FlgD